MRYKNNSFINIPDCRLNIDFMNKKNKEEYIDECYKVIAIIFCAFS